ncbi:NCS1 family nucleobase:cation symporter-1 [Kyrpidia spormannii]|uniref:NCS1 nucleoside transporter family protein n=2 Tax=Kyrpidia spormannii TaxID=2055160 RepID=A0ACA8ZCY6_9BACL|nr:NCS1 family nucleobase:cation symporter-1 [Kyrpidia spormannii]CAB3395380.1 NCS1 nucleoside transporter family protein [Kyrpidia spormannii]CAB3396117.1 NCS1 nucleoside transporter family protein [Kyrpidia spormannii]
MNRQIESRGIVTLDDETAKELSLSPLWNDDLRPTTRGEHHWTTWHFAALWISMCLCIPAYTLAGGLIDLGMNWWQAVLTVVIGNLIVLIPILLNSHAGVKFGIPYPVYARLWFGASGAHIPAMARAIVAAGWFGINCWIGTTAIDGLIQVVFPGWDDFSLHTAVVFLFFWGLNVWVAYRGPESIKNLMRMSAPLLTIAVLVLFIWAVVSAGGFGPMLASPSKFQSPGEFLKIFFPSLMGVIAFWATMALNIPDFCRYARSQKDQVVGQAAALPATMGLFSFIAIAVTSATVVLFGKALWDPVQILTKFPAPVVLVGAIVITISSLAINVGANVVAPARAIENLWPQRITFGLGAIITGIIGILIQPWYIMSNFGHYIFGWLGTYGALLGPIDGIAIADYWIVRKQRLALAELYEKTGRYNYQGGVNWNSVIALIVGVGVPVLGLVIPPLRWMWDNALAVGMVVAMIVYAFLMRNHSTLLSAEEYQRMTQFESVERVMSQPLNVPEAVE